jgi:hypothetical protein
VPVSCGDQNAWNMANIAMTTGGGAGQAPCPGSAHISLGPFRSDRGTYGAHNRSWWASLASSS